MNYLQTAWGEQLDNVSITDVKNVIVELLEMDDEHGAFWVGMISDEEITLEVDKWLKVIANFSDETQIVKQFDNWNEIEMLYQYLLDERYDLLNEAMRF